MTPDESLWLRLEADFARVLGEIPRPEGRTLTMRRCGRRDRIRQVTPTSAIAWPEE